MISSQRAILGIFLVGVGGGPLAAAARREDPVAARPVALGGAFLAVEDDPVSPLFNPAALSLSTRTFGTGGGWRSASRGSLFRPTGWASYADGSDDGASGLGVWGSGDRGQDPGNRKALGLTWAREVASSFLGGRLNAGVTVKYLNASPDAVRAAGRSALGVDAGLLYVNDLWSLGASARDVNEPRLGSGLGLAAPAGTVVGRRDPALFGLGASLRAGEATLVLLDADQPSFGEPLRARVGVETRAAWDFLALRAGAGTDRAGIGFGLGGGPNFPASLDYGFSTPYDSKKNGRLHAVSLAFRFGGPTPSEAPAAASAAPTAAPSGGAGDANSIAWRTAPSRPTYPLGPDDVVQIAVKNHPELNATGTVDSRGFISLAYIGDLNVKGLSPDGLEQVLKKIYSGFFTGETDVDVTVRDYNSRTVTVVGAVKAPGKYSLKGAPLTLKDILFMAGLPTERAALWRVFIVRQTLQGPRPISVNVNKILYRGQVERDLELQSGDIVYVPMGFLDWLAVTIGRIVGPILGVARNSVVATTGTGL